MAHKVLNCSSQLHCDQQFSLLFFFLFFVSSSPYFLFLQVVMTLIVLALMVSLAESSIGYFESYGWPSYGIVKPFWMAPFSAHPSRPISSYSRKHNVMSAGIISGPHM